MARIRVTLRWIKILDTLEPFYKETGEFRFRSRVSSERAEGFSHETRFPEEGHYSLSDKPGYNYVTLNKTLFEGDVDDHLVVEFDIEQSHLASQALRYQLQLQLSIFNNNHIGIEEHIQDFILTVAQSSKQDCRWQFALAINSHIDKIFCIKLKVQPGATVGNNAGRI